MGLGDPYCLSSISGSGLGELLDDLVEQLPKEFYDETEGLPKFAIVGQPNVGKSSLLNMFTGEERSIVTPLAGTTRDTIYKRYSKYVTTFCWWIPGVRRKNKVKEDLEYYSVLRSIRAIEESDVCLFMIDAQRKRNQRAGPCYLQFNTGIKGVLIIVNKWDLMERIKTPLKKYTEMIQSKIAPFTDVPVVFTSVHDKPPDSQSS